MAHRPNPRPIAAAAVLLSLLVLVAAPAAAGGPPTAATTGGGVYQLLGNLPTDFAFSAIQLPGGRAAGTFYQRVIFQGQLVEFTGEVTCVTQDPANHRAWVGGVVTTNTSAHPSFLQPRNAPGRDVWFRVVDYGEGGSAPADRSTFLGFEGDAGIITSPEYCAVQPWPANDDRTWPVSEGNLQVHD